MSLGKLLKNSRTKAGLTQGDVAKVIGTSITFISAMEKDASKIPMTHLKKICWLLKIDESRVMRAMVSQYKATLQRKLNE